MRIGEIRFAGLAPHRADRFDEHALGKFFGKIRLVEPHHLDGAGGVGNYRLTHGDLSFPRPSRLQFGDGPEYRHRRAGDQAFYRRIRPALIVPDGEVVEKVAHRDDPELLETGDLCRSQTEVLYQGLIRQHPDKYTHLFTGGSVRTKTTSVLWS